MKVQKLLVLALLAVPSQGQAPLDGIPGVVAKGESVRLVKEGFVFTEGPVGMADGGLYFSDLQTADRINRLDPKGEITSFREKTNGANGLAVARTGEVFAVESTGKRVVRISNNQVTVLTEGSPDKPLLAPNDLILDSKGGIYFTDPGPRPVVPGRKVYVECILETFRLRNHPVRSPRCFAKSLDVAATPPDSGGDTRTNT